MTSFFVDIWADLREKRLWPAAVGLLAAIVAVPVVLFKPASDAAPPSAVAPHGKQGPILPVVHVDGGPLMGSHLEAFSASEKNPFKPMKDLAKAPGGRQRWHGRLDRLQRRRHAVRRHHQPHHEDDRVVPLRGGLQLRQDRR